MTLKICMLLPIRYGPNMRVNPQIGIFSYLSHFGHEITWVLSAEDSRTTQKITHNGIQVYAAPYIHYLNEHSLLGKIVNRIPATFSKMRLTLKVFKESKYDMVFVRDDIFGGLLATYIKRRYRIPLVYELSSPLEEEWEAYKIEAKASRYLWQLLAKLRALLRIYVLRRADLILPTTRWFKEGLAEKGISSAKLMPFPNGVDIESFSNKDGREIRQKYHLGNSKVIIYLGVIGKGRKLNVLINAFLKVREQRKDVKLLMVGDGTDRQNLEKLTSKLGIKDEVIFTGQVHQSEVPNFIAAADIGVSPVPPLSFYKVSSPIKTLEYMTMAKPVVANEEIHEHKEIIEQSGGGILVPFTSEAFASAIIKLLNDSEKAEEMGRQGHEWVVKNRTYEMLARKLEERCFQLILASRRETE